MASTRGAHKYQLRVTMTVIDRKVNPEQMTGLPDGWRYVHHLEVLDEDDPGDPESGIEPLKAGDAWSYWTLDVDAVMTGPADRWEADRVFRDLAEQFSGARPGPGSNWSLRSASR